MTQHSSSSVRFVARVVVPLSLLAGAAAVLFLSARDAFDRPREARVAPVAVVPIASSRVQAMDSGAMIQAPGWIEPAPYAVDVPALREGVVATLHVLEGDAVVDGAMIATLESASERLALARAESELAAATADVSMRAAALAAADRALHLALDAERDLAIARAMVDEASAMVARIEAELDEAAALRLEALDEFERKSQLVDTGGAAAGEVRRLGLKADAARARYDALGAERSARIARRASAEATLVAARTRRRELLDETRARDEARAALASAEATRDARAAMREDAALELARSEIRAPRAGVVLARFARPGTRTSESEPLVSLYDPASLQVRCDVPLKDAGRLAVGLRAEVRVDALPDRSFAGTVVLIASIGDLQKNTLQCKVRLDDVDPVLRPDMLARVRLHAATDASSARSTGEGLVAPSEAIRRAADGTTSVVVAIRDGRSARTELRAVALGEARADGWVEVLDGLHAGDRVVLDAGIEVGSRIAPREALGGGSP